MSEVGYDIAQISGLLACLVDGCGETYLTSPPLSPLMSHE